MNRCWICDISVNDPMLLPYEDEYIGLDIPIFKNTFLIKQIDKFVFLYYLCCNKCIDNYLKYHGQVFKLIKTRELGLKN